MSAFYVWAPCIKFEDSRQLELVLTNGDAVGGIFNSLEFVENLLQEVGTKVHIAKWSIDPYRTKYYSDYLDEDDWRDVWQLVWKVRLTAKHEIDQLWDMTVPWIGIDATARGWVEGPEDEAVVGCLVISDFDNDSALETTQASLKGDAFAEMREKYSVDGPELCLAELPGKYKQLQIDLGQFPGRFFAQGADYAELVIDQCVRSGGIIHYGKSHPGRGL